MKPIDLYIRIIEAENSEELQSEDQDLVSLAREMTNNAYAPYSEFFVGAAILLENGKIVKGSNQENAAYPSGLCAERVAVFAASSEYPDVKIKSIAISARSNHRNMDYPVSPCGACRQVLLEYEFKQQSPVKMLLSGDKGKIVIIEKVKDLLPLSFTSDDLKKI
jgi:cytidine deaminase